VTRIEFEGGFPVDPDWPPSAPAKGGGPFDGDLLPIAPDRWGKIGGRWWWGPLEADVTDAAAEEWSPDTGHEKRRRYGGDYRLQGAPGNALYPDGTSRAAPIFWVWYPGTHSSR
jgi:hypothetical protein